MPCEGWRTSHRLSPWRYRMMTRLAAKGQKGAPGWGRAAFRCVLLQFNGVSGACTFRNSSCPVCYCTSLHVAFNKLYPWNCWLYGLAEILIRFCIELQPNLVCKYYHIGSSLHIERSTVKKGKATQLFVNK
jgi:hypothetical protein